MPRAAEVKNKIKRVGRLRGASELHHDIPLIFSNITSPLTRKLPGMLLLSIGATIPLKRITFCVQVYFCDRRSIPLISSILPSKK